MEGTTPLPYLRMSKTINNISEKATGAEGAEKKAQKDSATFCLRNVLNSAGCFTGRLQRVFKRSDFMGLYYYYYYAAAIWRLYMCKKKKKKKSTPL